MVGLLLACVEQASSSLSNDGSNSSNGTIARSALTHLAGTSRVNSAKYSTCLHRFARVVALPVHPGYRDNNNCDSKGPERSRGGSGRCRATICTVGVPATDMACGVDLGNSLRDSGMAAMGDGGGIKGETTTSQGKQEGGTTKGNVTTVWCIESWWCNKRRQDNACASTCSGTVAMGNRGGGAMDGGTTAQSQIAALQSPCCWR
jgi:hypothetical protein